MENQIYLMFIQTEPIGIETNHWAYLIFVVAIVDIYP